MCVQPRRKIKTEAKGRARLSTVLSENGISETKTSEHFFQLKILFNLKIKNLI